MKVEKHNNPNFPTIISDSFLRSYSLSRIVRINEQNRNKAKVAIMRKIREIKQSNNQKHYIPQINSINVTKKFEKPTNIKDLKQQLSIIDDPDRVETPQQKVKKSRNQSRNQSRQKNINRKNQSHELLSSKSLVTKNQNHRRFPSNPQSSNLTQQSFFKNKNLKARQNNKFHAKTQLRMTNLSFNPSLCKNSELRNSMPVNQQQLEYLQGSLSTALNSFNKLKLIMNTKSSQNIMKHFYKRSLQNCTVDDIKFLIKMQNRNQNKNQNVQNYQCTPMKFGKVPYLKGTFGSLQDNNSSIINKNDQKTVWKNQILKKSCPFQQKAKNQNDKTQRNIATQQHFQRDLKRNTLDARSNKFSQKEKQNYETQQLFNKMTDKSVEIEKNLIFCYKDKRFPMNENKLNGVYKKWQQQHLRKKNHLEMKDDQQLFVQQLKTKNIRKQISNKNYQQLHQNLQTQQSQTSLIRNTIQDEKECEQFQITDI